MQDTLCAGRSGVLLLPYLELIKVGQVDQTLALLLNLTHSMAQHGTAQQVGTQCDSGTAGIHCWPLCNMLTPQYD